MSTAINPKLVPEKIATDIYKESVRTNRFARYVGDDESSMIHIKEDLAKDSGETIHLGLLTKMTGPGRKGYERLEGFEEDLKTHEDQITIDWLRHAVKVNKKDAKKSPYDLMVLAKSALKTWRNEMERDRIIARLVSPNLDGMTPYAQCTPEARSLWLAENGDRIVVGSKISNRLGDDHDKCLATIDKKNDKLSPEIISLAKSVAEDAKPAMRPLKVSEDEEWWVMFVGSRAFRDYRSHPAVIDVYKHAGDRGKDNPLFHSGDLIWDNIIIRKVPEMPIITGAGNGGVDIAPCVLCGAQAIGVAIGQRPKPIFNKDDYDFVNGVGIEECSEAKKLVFQQKQHGVVTVYVAAEQRI